MTNEAVEYLLQNINKYSFTNRNILSIIENIPISHIP